MNVTLDDSAPQLQYFGNWTSWRPLNRDPWTPQYYRGTFHGTPTEGAYMRLAFNGTGAWIYGSMSSNHGAYSARVDGGPDGTYMGYADNRTLNQLLYYTAGLGKDREHVVEIYNRPSRTGSSDPVWWLDIDYVVVELPEPEDLVTTIIDDSATRITYSSGFKAKSDAGDGYYNVTAHQATEARESFTLPFTGSSIQLFGTISPETGNFSVAIDGNASPDQLNGTWYEKRTNSPLFFASGLSEGEHSLTLVNEGTGDNKQAFEFDYAVVNASRASLEAAEASGGGVVEGGLPSGGTGDKPSVPTGTDSALSNTSSGSSHDPIGPIVGGVVGGAALLAAAILGWFFWRKKQKKDSDRLQRRREAARLSSNTSEYTGSEVKPFPHGMASRVGDAGIAGGAYGIHGPMGQGQGGHSARQSDHHDQYGHYPSHDQGRLGHGHPGTRTMDSRSEYSQSTDHQGFAFLTDHNAPPLPGSSAGRNGDRLFAHRPSSPGAMSAYTGYESAGPAPSSQARGSMVMLPSAGAGSSSFSGGHTGTGSGTTWVNEKDALRRHLYDPSNDGTATFTSHGTLPNPYAANDGRRQSPQAVSQSAGLGDTIRQRSMLSPLAHTATGMSNDTGSSGMETMSDTQVTEAKDSLGRMMTHSRNGSLKTSTPSTAQDSGRGHRRGPSGSTVQSPDSAEAGHEWSVPADAPPGYSESVVSGGRRTRSGKSRSRGNKV